MKPLKTVITDRAATRVIETVCVVPWWANETSKFKSISFEKEKKGKWRTFTLHVDLIFLAAISIDITSCAPLGFTEDQREREREREREKWMIEWNIRRRESQPSYDRPIDINL
jgi:hypothetical protein